MSDRVPPAEDPFLPPPPPAAAGPTSGPGAPPPGPTAPAALRPLRSLGTAIGVMVGVVAVINLASIPNDLAYISSMQSAIDGDITPGLLSDIEDQEDLRATFALLSIGAMLLAGVVWVIWQQRARANATALGAGGQRHGRVLAVAGWFIPIANLFIPKQVTDDLWRASDPEAERIINTAGRPVWGGVHLWWGLWVTGAILGRILRQRSAPETIDDLSSAITSVRIEVFTQLVAVAAAVLAVIVVHRITARLGERATNAGTHMP